MSVTVVVPWPRYPTVTPGGKPSTAKNAGRLVPWLSANAVNNLPAPVYRKIKIAWREASAEEAEKSWRDGFDESVTVSVRLYKATASLMDASAVVEGLKPVLDGLEAVGVLVNDYQVKGFPWAEALKAASRADCRVEIELSAVTP